jgi:PAS domain S-box-containing protein
MLDAAMTKEQLSAEVCRRRAELEAGRQAVTIGSLLDSISDIIFYKDLNGVYLGCNLPFAELVGMPRDEIIGKTDHFLFSKEEADFYREQDRRTLEQSGPRRMEEWITYRDGREKLVDTLKTPLRGPDGALMGILGISRDITERKRMEQQRQQLLKAKSLTRMAGAIAHHFNNQLAVVIGSLELAAEDLGPDHFIAPALAESRKAALKAADTSVRILAYLGQPSGQLTPLDLVQTCRGALERQIASLPRSITLETSLPSDRLTIEGNGAKVEQVLSNLIRNAKEAIGEAEGTIRVAVRVAPASEAISRHTFPAGWQPERDLYACMEVSDTGCGIASEHLDSIFDPFFSTRFTVRGLGLAEVQGILRMHGGAVSVDSLPGLGSVLRLFWPLAALEAVCAPKPEPPAIQPAEIAGCVLVVDDDSSLRKLAAKMLGRLGCQVVTAAGGLDAVEILRACEEKIRLVLLDLTMPGLNGWQTLEDLRAVRPDSPVILASGYDEAQAMEGKHAQFPQTFLHKPYGLRDLQKALGEALTANYL